MKSQFKILEGQKRSFWLRMIPSQVSKTKFIFDKKRISRKLTKNLKSLQSQKRWFLTFRSSLKEWVWIYSKYYFLIADMNSSLGGFSLSDRDGNHSWVFKTLHFYGVLDNSAAPWMVYRYFRDSELTSTCIRLHVIIYI